MIATNKQSPKFDLPAPPQNRLLVDGVTWQKYEQLLDLFDEHPFRLTYDHGKMEIVVITSKHEEWRRLLDMLITMLAIQLNYPIKGLGSTTFRRKTQMRGLEPDDCYWFKNEEKVRNLQQYDAEKDPPPELVLEIDITSSSIDRIDICQSLGVQEVWRWNNDQLEVRVLNKGTYRLRRRSSVIPGLKPNELIAFVEIAFDKGEVEMMRQFQKWTKEKIAAGSLKSD